MSSKTGMFVFVSFILLAATASAQTTFCTSETNISTGQSLNLNLAGVAYHVVQNFITPSYAGMTINGTSYTLYPNSPQTISQNTGAYVELAQINYVPKISSVNFILCSAPQGPSTQYNFNLSGNEYGELYFTYYGTKLIVASHPPVSQVSTNYPTSVTVTNVTASTPPPPSGYVKLTALNVSVVTGTNATINMTQAAPCYATPSTIAVYKLVQGSWTLVTGYTFNSTACTVTASVPMDPVVGIFYSSQATTVPGASTTSISTSTTSTTTAPTTVSSTTSIFVNTLPTTSTTTVRTTVSTSSTSIYTTLPTTTVTTSVPTTISIPPQTTVQTSEASGAQVNLIRYAILGAMALLFAYLIYLLVRKDPVLKKQKKL